MAVCIAGDVPSSFCHLPSTINVAYNYGLTCFPLCLRSRHNQGSFYTYPMAFNDCTPSAEKVLCGFIETTNIGSVYSEWQCTEEGRTATDACATSWHGVQCDESGKLSGLTLENNQLTGLNLICSLRYNFITISMCANIGVLPSSLVHLSAVHSFSSLIINNVDFYGNNIIRL
jgi:hypothetical protein